MQGAKSSFTRQDVKSPSTGKSSCKGGGTQLIAYGVSLFIRRVAMQSIYKCKNTGQLINFYYTTLGYPVISTWVKAIDKGYF
ncbi:hypothetical protein ACHAW6_005347 [Cyclotella cf. meneghiniana]